MQAGTYIYWSRCEGRQPAHIILAARSLTIPFGCRKNSSLPSLLSLPFPVLRSDPSHGPCPPPVEVPWGNLLYGAPTLRTPSNGRGSDPEQGPGHRRGRPWGQVGAALRPGSPARRPLPQPLGRRRPGGPLLPGVAGAPTIDNSGELGQAVPSTLLPPPPLHTAIPYRPWPVPCRPSTTILPSTFFPISSEFRPLAFPISSPACRLPHPSTVRVFHSFRMLPPLLT